MTTPPDLPPELFPALAALLENHKGRSHVSAAEYKRAKRHMLGQKVLQRERIYLDMNHWIGLRDARLGKASDPRYSSLLTHLQKLVECEHAVIPLTNHLAEEIFRQSDKRTRTITAETVDLLTRGLGIARFGDRQAIEVEQWIRSLLDREHLPLELLVWTFSPFIYGEILVTPPGDPELAEAAAKAVDDLAELMCFSDMASQIPAGPPETTWEKHAHDLSQRKVGEWKDQGDFQDVLLEESMGYWDFLWDQFVELLESELRELQERMDWRGKGLKDTIKLAVFGCMQLGILKKRLPGMQIVAGGNARIRIDKGRQFKPGDAPDLFHAAAALPYCTVFITDSSLRHLLTTRPTDLGGQFGCRVISDLDEALDCLSELGPD